MRPVNKGKSPYIRISDYKEALPYLEDRLGSYCSYCGYPISHVPEVEHVLSKSVDPSRITEWENLLLGCKYCNTRKSNKITGENVGDYLWPDTYNTAIAFDYAYGIPQIRSQILQELDPSGAARRKAENIFELIRFQQAGDEASEKTDRRTRKRNEVYVIACRSKERWQRNRIEDMKEQIIDSALGSGFFSVWTTVFADEPEVLRALIEAFPGTEKEFFDENGLPKPVLERTQELSAV